MSFLTADRIHNGQGWLPPGSVIDVAGDGTIVAVFNGPHPDANHYEGVLAPGFVNVHCHLELSHLKGCVPEHTGLIPFLQSIPSTRNSFSDEQKQAARLAAYEQLLRNGVVAVGDIANTTESLDLRALDQLHIHTFIESIGFLDARADIAYGYASGNLSQFASQTGTASMLRQSITPHAPYSVSPTLFRKIAESADNRLISIHNEECADENSYFVSKQGGVGHLLHALGIDDSGFLPTGKTSLKSYAEWLNKEQMVILVHNTFSDRDDVRFAEQYFKGVYWCLCPNANLYIENRLPDVPMLATEGRQICVGTDSLASNHQLCVLAELSTIHHHFPAIGWEQLLTWGTYNGAMALQMDHRIGTIAAGKRPGIVHITGLDEENRVPAIQRIV